MQNEQRKILLFQDNFSGHIIPDTLTNIQVKNFELNLTAHVQPIDQGIIQCFKAHYRAKFIHCAIDHYEAGITPSEIYNIDQLEAMRLTQDAWNEVDTTTIRNCWRKADILPDPETPLPAQPSLPISTLIHLTNVMNNPAVHAETLIENALDDLQATGALQALNWMDISALLNPALETCNIFDVTDEDIVESMMDVKKLWERNGGSDDDNDLDTDMPVPGLAHCNALWAAIILRKYVRSFDDPFACKLEVMLGSFGQWTHAVEMQGMKDMKLTDCFSHK
ncbi:hypothetical protein PAXRUDRAFT_18282 [Paxillus rubicundulus Ve08.2h10]|uniref:DDE-1 domain-containing protein n=1 Tax=Paxillus rubicundulus Ve08.2h10 TaxID=930991 RepID=A0A0D0BZ00_9AGAM|nr:hypothetical protein PAXRUDRAFT_18282 [Paxillus rubicundulus Ve08.2h10]